jgi:hypothetical protein
MIKEDLEYIFKPQVDEGTTKLYFMLIDGEHKVIERHPTDNFLGLLPMLDSFQYHGTESRIPRFVK